MGGVFRPNDDTLRVSGVDVTGKFIFRVYDMSDQILFETYNPNVGWNGMSSKYTTTSEYVPGGVYKYTIQYNSQTYKGQFEVRY